MTLVRTFLAALAAITSVAAVAAEVSVLSDLDAAKALAAKEGKQIVVEFSGRTWCPPCKELVKEVIPSAEFAAFAATRVVVHLDYPRRSERTPEMIAANPQLAKLMAWAEAYKIEGFPTVILLDAHGAEIGRTVGYEPGMAASAFLAQLTNGT